MCYIFDPNVSFRGYFRRLEKCVSFFSETIGATMPMLEMPIFSFTISCVIIAGK